MVLRSPMSAGPSLRLFVSCLALLLLASGASAAPLTAPERMDQTTPDTTPYLYAASSAVLCYLDDDGSNTYTAGEPVSVHPTGNCGRIQNAVRLAEFAGRPAGAAIGAQDPDGSVHVHFTQDPPSFAYVDRNGDGTLSVGDTVYVDTLNPGGRQIQAGDVRLVPFGDLPGGAYVQAGDADAGTSVSHLGLTQNLVGFSDVNGNGQYDTGDSIFLRDDDERTFIQSLVQIGDLRLGGSDAQRFGTYVRLGDPDAPAILRTMPGPSLCVADTDDNGVDPQDPVVLRSGGCAGTVQQHEVRISRADDGPARVQAGESIIGTMLSEVSGTFVYIERDGKTGFGIGDRLYLNRYGGAGQVDQGDIRLTPQDGLRAAAPVRAGDADEGDGTLSLGDLSTVLTFVDVEGNGRFDASDLPYANADQGGAEDVERGDVRLGTLEAERFFFGSQVTAGAPELVRRLSDTPFDLCVLDEDGDAVYDLGEPLLVNPGNCSDGTRANAVRLTVFDGFASGTRLTGNQAGATAFRPNYELAFLDNDLSSSWTLGDTLYVHFTGSGSLQVKVGDYRLTTFDADHPAGTVVTSTARDANTPLERLGTTFVNHARYVDLDLDGVYSAEDGVYLDVTGRGDPTTSYGFVRLAALAGPEDPYEPPTQEPEPTETAQPTETTTATPPDSASPTPTDDTETSSPTTSDEDAPRRDVSTPGPGLAVVLALMALLAVALRRRG